MTEPIKPSQVDEHVGPFDRFAASAATFVAKAPFFIACAALVLVWAPSYFVLRNLDTWQLIINTATTIITFLLVALLQNSEHRADAAVQKKLNAIADGLADFMVQYAQDHPADCTDLLNDVRELQSAVGLEKREST